MASKRTIVERRERLKWHEDLNCKVQDEARSDGAALVVDDSSRAVGGEVCALTESKTFLPFNMGKRSSQIMDEPTVVSPNRNTALFIKKG